MSVWPRNEIDLGCLLVVDGDTIVHNFYTLNVL